VAKAVEKSDNVEYIFQLKVPGFVQPRHIAISICEAVFISVFPLQELRPQRILLKQDKCKGLDRVNEITLTPAQTSWMDGELLATITLVCSLHQMHQPENGNLKKKKKKKKTVCGMPQL
jgi:hypothetical protein